MKQRLDLVTDHLLESPPVRGRGLKPKRKVGMTQDDGRPPCGGAD